MSCGSLRMKRSAILAVFVLVLSMTRAEVEEKISNDSDEGRLYFNNQNSTLIPLGSGGAMLVSTVGIIAIVIGAVVLFSLIFNHQGLKNGGSIFSPWLNQPGYPSGNQYYTQPQAQQYVYEPYSKLGYQSQPVSR